MIIQFITLHAKNAEPTPSQTSDTNAESVKITTSAGAAKKKHNTKIHTLSSKSEIPSAHPSRQKYRSKKNQNRKNKCR